MKNTFFLVAALTLTLVTTTSFAQDWTLSGNSINGSEWFGAQGTGTGSPLTYASSTATRAASIS
jgi:hypothetical protein